MGCGGGPSAKDEVHKDNLKAPEIIMEGVPPVMYRHHVAFIEFFSLPPARFFNLWVLEGAHPHRMRFIKMI